MYFFENRHNHIRRRSDCCGAHCLFRTLLWVPAMLKCRSFACHIQSRLSLLLPLSTKLVIPSFIPSLRTIMTPSASSDWRRVSSGTAPPFLLFTKPIHKSEQDDREYSIILLDNGLQATLVHDAQADKAAASLDVAVGHLSDPVSR